MKLKQYILEIHKNNSVKELLFTDLNKVCETYKKLVPGNNGDCDAVYLFTSKHNQKCGHNSVVY